jgi:dephospho-CoA kinase
VKPLTIGLAGGIGSGKSTVSKILAELGAPIIDADKVGHAIYEPGGPAYQDLINAFGEGVLAQDGTVDRRKLGSLVFADPAALKRLNAIVHPKMFVRMGEMVADLRRRGETLPIVIEAAILVEANWQPLFEEIWLVTASREHVVERVARERRLKREQIEARLNSQLSDEERRKHTTVVISNDGTVEELRATVKRLWEGALARAA